MPEAEDIDEGQKTKDLIASQFHLAATPHTMLSLEAVRASNVALPLPPETCNLAAPPEDLGAPQRGPSPKSRLPRLLPSPQPTTRRKSWEELP